MDISIWIEANFNFLLNSFGFVPSIVDYTTLMFEIYFCFNIYYPSIYLSFYYHLKYSLLYILVDLIFFKSILIGKNWDHDRILSEVKGYKRTF